MRKNKLYFFLSILTIIFLFSFAALCTQCGTATEEEKIGIEEEEEAVAAEEEAVAEEEEAVAEEEVTEEGEAAAEEEVTEEEEEAVAEEKEAPTIELEIYEGPTYSAADDVCYYRVKAVITGKPSPTIEFSRDDSHGAWGSKKAQVNLTRDVPTYTLNVSATNSEGEATDSIELNWGCGPLVVEHTIDLNPSISGTVGPAGFVTTAFLAIGDSTVNTDWRGRFAFDVSSLAGKEIVNAKLKLANPDLSPNPCNFKGNIVIFYNDFLPGLDSGDYYSLAYAGPQIFFWNAEPLEFSTDFLKTKIAERASAHVELQFGIGYENTATGGLPGVAEGRVYYANDITLTITYTE